MEKTILSLFTINKKLSFNQIEKQTKQRSNKLSYHLNKLTKSGKLIKEDNYYTLADNFEHLIPYISEKKATLPVIIIHIGDNKKAFLYSRKKRPYIDKISLPGGRLILGESIEQGAIRIMKEKFNINIKNPKIKSIIHEHVIKNKKIIHSFVIFLVKARADVKLTDIKHNKKNIIKSDYKMINLKDEKININKINSFIS